jgi:pilus assembly protein CpaC
MRTTRIRIGLGLAGVALAILLAFSAGAVETPAPRLQPRGGMIWLRAPLDDSQMLQELELEENKSVSVATEYRVRRVSVGNPEIVDVVVVNPNQLQLVARGIGATNVIVWDAANRPQAVIDLHVSTAHSQISSRLREIVNSPNLQLSSAGDSIILQGSVPGALEAEKAVEITRAFLPKDKRDNIVNLLEVGGGQQIMLEVVIAEMARTLRRQLGTNFHTIIGSGDQTFEFFNLLGNLTSVEERSFLFDLDSFELLEIENMIELSDSISFAATGFGVGTGTYEFFFDILERNGLGKILAEPTLVARSGETASFLAGGEIPIPVAQGGAFGSITIEYKEFGVGLKFLPTVLSPDRIHLNVTPEVSEPDFAFGTQLGGIIIPAFRTRRATTGIELADGQTFAIAGLLRDDVTESIDQYPILGDLPVLGALFRSSTFQRNESELVMIVTPRLVRPLDPGPRPLPTDHFVEPSAFEFYLLGRLEARPEAIPPAAEGGSLGGIVGPAGHRVPAGSPPQESR